MTQQSRQPGKARQSVVVVYEDTPAREAAVAFCDELTKRFWESCDFDLGWWSFGELLRTDSGHAATALAVEADMVVFATHPEGEFSEPIRAWMEGWLLRRGDREGALVAVVGPSALHGRPAEKCLLLRSAAHRAGMDYLTQVPQGLRFSTPDSLESYSERADQVTSVIDEILRAPAPVPTLLTQR
jgi:hypothetical protein